MAERSGEGERLPPWCALPPSPADLAALDALARAQLVARRLGCRIRLTGASAELIELLVGAGLDGVLGVEPGGEAEQGEPPLDV